jgi:serine/threonine protein kinase
VPSPKSAKQQLQTATEANLMLQHLLESYDCGDILGKGSSAQVFEVIHKDTGVKYACKVVHKNSSLNDHGTMSTEAEIMKRMNHPNVTSLHELYETSSSKWFILELAREGSLQSVLAAESEYTEGLVAESFAQILKGVEYLHSLGIVHRDLKQDNILCAYQDVDGEKKIVPKIVDFGLSAIIDHRACEASRVKRYRKLKQLWGTREYFAPEVYEKAYGPQVDVWALGCVLYELLVGETPFPVREKPVSAVERILLNGGHKIKRSFELRLGWQALSAEARDLISRMLKVNPRRRLSVAECLAHPWITGESLPAATVSTGGDAGASVSRSKVLHEARRVVQKRVHVTAHQHKVLLASSSQEMLVPL